jgi:BirA family biotin operon repressor/biotin-[acetyl-CoA-carboxylase] ligase
MRTNQQSFPFIKLDVVDSTNNYAMNLVKEGWTKNLACIWARDQNQGKGQRGNTWLTEAGKNLTCSIIFFPASLDAGDNFFLSMVACLAAMKFLQSSCQDVQIKWPNDLYLAGKKTGGILIENTLEKENIRSSVIGIGVNLNQKEFPPDIPNATSVLLSSGKESDIEKSVLALYSSLVENLKKLDMKLYDEIKNSYLLSLFGFGIQLTFRDINGEFRGIIEGIENTGELLIKDTEGKQRKYAFKEVEMIV